MRDLALNFEITDVSISFEVKSEPSFRYFNILTEKKDFL